MQIAFSDFMIHGIEMESVPLGGVCQHRTQSLPPWTKDQSWETLSLIMGFTSFKKKIENEILKKWPFPLYFIFFLVDASFLEKQSLKIVLVVLKRVPCRKLYCFTSDVGPGLEIPRTDGSFWACIIHTSCRAVKS